MQKQVEAVPSVSPSVEVIHLDCDEDEDEDEDVRKALALSLKDTVETNLPMAGDCHNGAENAAEGSPKANTCWVQVMDEEVANSFTRIDWDEPRQGRGEKIPYYYNDYRSVYLYSMSSPVHHHPLQQQPPPMPLKVPFYYYMVN